MIESITVDGKKYPLTPKKNGSHNYYELEVIIDGKCVASIGVNGKQIAKKDAVARAQIAVRSYNENNGKWSYLGDSDEDPTMTLEEAMETIDEKCDCYEFNYHCQHWAFERFRQNNFFRFLVWDKNVADRIFDRFKELGIRVF